MSKHRGQIQCGDGFAFPRAGADDDNGVELFVLAREQDVGAQDTVGFGVLAFGAFIHQVADVLRDDSEHRRLECAFHLFNRLDAGIQILNEESQTDTHNQTDDDAENDVQGFVWFDRVFSGLGRVRNFHD